MRAVRKATFGGARIGLPRQNATKPVQVLTLQLRHELLTISTGGFYPRGKVTWLAGPCVLGRVWEAPRGPSTTVRRAVVGRKHARNLIHLHTQRRSVHRPAPWSIRDSYSCALGPLLYIRYV